MAAIASMFDLVLTHRDASFEHQLFKDGSRFRVVSEWETMAELIIVSMDGDRLVGIPVSNRMRDELRQAEDYVGPYSILSPACRGRRSVQWISNCWGMCLPLSVPSPSYGAGQYRFTVLFDRVETGRCDQDDSTIRLVPWLERVEFRAL